MELIISNKTKLMRKILKFTKQSSLSIGYVKIFISKGCYDKPKTGKIFNTLRRVLRLRGSLKTNLAAVLNDIDKEDWIFNRVKSYYGLINQLNYPIFDTKTDSWYIQFQLNNTGLEFANRDIMTHIIDDKRRAYYILKLLHLVSNKS